MAPRIVVTRAGATPPFSVDAVVLEDDTEMVLGSDPVAKEAGTPPSELLRRALGAAPRPPGTVVVEEGAPLRFHVVVHDLSVEPSWREEWVSTGLDRLFRVAGERGISSLALPVLGGLHGRLGARRFCELLAEELQRVTAGSLERIWLVVAEDVSGVQERLRQLGCDVEG